MRQLRRLFPVLASAAFVAAACAQAPAEPPAEPMPDRAADEAAIRAVIAGVQEGINSRDFAAFAAQFTSDGDLIAFDMPKATGPDAVRQSIQMAWAEAPADRTIAITVDSIRFVGSDVAIVDNTGTLSSGEPAADRATGVMVRQGDGAWKTVSLRVYQAAAGM
jgi:uncharacterized protein (TIGR02246 family)